MHKNTQEFSSLNIEQCTLKQKEPKHIIHNSTYSGDPTSIIQVTQEHSQ